MKNVFTVIPTRGLVFARTIVSLARNKIDEIHFIQNLPIPDAHNEGVRAALFNYVPYILFVEEDMEIPDNVIYEMLKIDKPIVACDYPMDNGYSTICKVKEEIWWCGLGCTMIKRGVFENMKDPWFDSSYSWRIEEPFSLTRIENPNKYGGHDVNFGMKVREMGFEIVQVPGFEAKHLRCDSLDKGKYNEGVSPIRELLPVSKRQEY